MKKIRTYVCWDRNCLKREKRILEKNLIKRYVEKGHIDYCCPNCGNVIICEHIK